MRCFWTHREGRRQNQGVGRRRDGRADLKRKIIVMKHADFRIGASFWTVTGEWRCTDIGSRTIIAIRLDKGEDVSWYSGPPYAIVEQVFDEDDLHGCFCDVQDVELVRARIRDGSEAVGRRVAASPEGAAFYREWDATSSGSLEIIVNRITDRNRHDPVDMNAPEKET